MNFALDSLCKYHILVGFRYNFDSFSITFGIFRRVCLKRPQHSLKIAPSWLSSADFGLLHPILARLGPMLAPCWRHVAASWSQVGPKLAPSWLKLRPSWPKIRPWTAQEAFLDAPGRVLEAPGVPGGLGGAKMVARSRQNEPKSTPKSTKFDPLQL